MNAENMKQAPIAVESKMPPVNPRIKTDYDRQGRPYDSPSAIAGEDPVPTSNRRSQYPSEAYLFGGSLFESETESVTRARIAASGASFGRQCQLLASALNISYAEAQCRVGLPFSYERAEKPEDQPARDLRDAIDISSKNGGTIVASVEEIERATLLADPRASKTTIAYRLANRNGTNVCDELALLRDVPREAHAVALFALSQRAADTADKNTPEARRAAHFADPKAASAAMAARYSPATAAWLSRAGRLP